MFLASIPPTGGGGVVGWTTSTVPLPDALPASLPAGLTGACEVVESEIVPSPIWITPVWDAMSAKTRLYCVVVQRLPSFAPVLAF